MQASRGSDSLQKRQRLGVAAGEDVLTIVDSIAGHRVAECVGSSAECRTGLEDVDRHAGFGKRRRGSKAGEPPANHDDGRVIHEALDLMCDTGSRRPDNVRAQVVSASRRRAGRGTRITCVNTSYWFASMRRRMPW